MKEIILIYKKQGETPLEAVRRFKEKNKEYTNKKIAYAGRLDPLAEGLLLLIIDKKLKDFDSYLKFDKEYEATILFGFSSDTYDILGIPQLGKMEEISPGRVEKTLKGLVGDFVFSLPPFSAYKIKKKPLFWWALERRLDEIEIPQKKSKIYYIHVEKLRRIEKNLLKNDITKRISAVKGNFRQKSIVDSWEKLFLKDKRKNFYTVKIKISCSSGCFVRSVVQKVGEDLKTGAVLLKLKRTKIGNYSERELDF
jgi:tRNA pseudouridine55 synthase